MFKGIVRGFFVSASLIAQTLSGSGYTVPAPVSVAPGQIATFYVPGTLFAFADTPPGTPLTATLQQHATSTPAPLSTCGSLTAVTVRIPYEPVPICTGVCPNFAFAIPPLLTLSQNGPPITSIELNPLADEVHVLTACDVALGLPTPQHNLTGLPCEPLVTHANGTLVSSGSPASVGEGLAICALGLGQTSPEATTGNIAAMAPTVEAFNLNFNYTIDALATKPYTGDPDMVPLHPLFAGLAPGYVGLYQLNFIVPAEPGNGIVPCSQPGSVALGGDVPQSNLTVSIGGQFSFDDAGICVTTQVPVD